MCTGQSSPGNSPAAIPIGHLALNIHLDYLVVGHVTRDLVDGTFTIGGTVSYSARTARALGCRVGVVTSASPDLDLSPVLDGVLVARSPAAATTTFENIYTPDGRHQVLHSVAEMLVPEMVPARWRASIVHIGPLVRECSPALVDRFGDSFVGLTPQGWMRQWDDAGNVRPSGWEASGPLLARADGQVFLLDANDLKLKKRFAVKGQTQPRFATAAPDGSWMAVLYHNRRLWLYDVQRQTPDSIALSGQGDISAVAFDGAERLLVSDRVDRVGVYQLPSGTVDRWHTPPIDTMRRVYRYLINPLYTIFPKPSEMDNSINYLLTEKETVALGPDQDDLSAAQLRIDPWGPLWSSLAFVVVVLALSCFYIQRQDF